MNNLKASLETVIRLSGQVDSKISQPGVLGPLSGMRKKLQESLSEISEGDLHILLAEAERAQKNLDQLKEDVSAIIELKRVFQSEAPPRSKPLQNAPVRKARGCHPAKYGNLAVYCSVGSSFLEPMGLVCSHSIGNNVYGAVHTKELLKVF